MITLVVIYIILIFFRLIIIIILDNICFFPTFFGFFYLIIGSFLNILLPEMPGAELVIVRIWELLVLLLHVKGWVNIVVLAFLIV
jgi:hypothetical protein